MTTKNPPESDIYENHDAEPISAIVNIPQNARDQLRISMGFRPDDPLRISYITGPGDLEGTFHYWRKGLLDPRVPTVAKSAMFYQLCDELSAIAQVIPDVQKGRSSNSKKNIRFDYIPRRTATGALQYYWSSVLRIIDAMRQIRRFSPHFIVVCTDFPGYGLPILKATGAKVILSMHNTYWTKGQPPAGWKMRLSNLGRKLWLKAVDASLCTSSECEQQFKRLTGGKIATFTNIPQQRRPKTTGLEVNSKSTKISEREILYLGRIEDAKGIFDLLEAFKAIRDDFKDVKLTFAGDGGSTQRLINAISDINDERVQFVGRLNADEVFQKLNQTHLIVCPTRNSFKEGLALVVIEAAVYGVPSVMSSAIPAAYLLPKSGEVYEADDVAALAGAIKKFLADPQFQKTRSTLALRESQKFFQREKSWGSFLYLAMEIAASK